MVGEKEGEITVSENAWSKCRPHSASRPMGGLWLLTRRLVRMEAN